LFNGSDIGNEETSLLGGQPGLSLVETDGNDMYGFRKGMVTIGGEKRSTDVRINA
jgi:hypothetical protein